MLSPDQFTARCRDCLANGGTPADIAALVRLAIESQLEEPDAWGQRELVHCSDDLMIVDLTMPPFATSAIHEHCTWAVVGVSQGCEVDELFVEKDGALERSARHELRSGDVLVLDPECIHFIANPHAQPTRGIHVYGKNLGLTRRRMWDPDTCVPRPMDFTQFEKWERFLTARSAAAGLIVPPTVR